MGRTFSLRLCACFLFCIAGIQQGEIRHANAGEVSWNKKIQLVTHAVNIHRWDEAIGIIINDIQSSDMSNARRYAFTEELLDIVCQSEHPDPVSSDWVIDEVMLDGAPVDSDVYDEDVVQELGDAEDELNTNGLVLIDFIATIINMCEASGVHMAIRKLRCIGMKNENKLGSTDNEIALKILRGLVRAGDVASIGEVLIHGYCPISQASVDEFEQDEDFDRCSGDSDCDGERLETLSGDVQKLTMFDSDFRQPMPLLLESLRSGFPYPRSSAVGSPLALSHILISIMDQPGGQSKFLPPEWLKNRSGFINALTNSKSLQAFGHSVSTRDPKCWYKLTEQTFQSIASEVSAPILKALLTNDKECVLKLLDEVDTRTGRTCLHLAAEIGSTDLVQLLIDFGADPFKSDVLGWTPLHIANRGFTSTQQNPIADILVQAAGERLIDVRDNQGRTAMDLQIDVASGASTAMLLDYCSRSQVSDFGGWPKLQLDIKCGQQRHVPVIAAKKDVQEQTLTPTPFMFEKEFVSLKIPCLIRQGAYLASAVKNLTLENVYTKYGSFEFEVSPVPYSGRYGTERMHRTTLKNFIDNNILVHNTSHWLLKCSDRLQSPDCFQDYILTELSSLQLDKMRDDFAGLEANPFFYHVDSLQKLPPQFYLGPVGSSSPFHSHQDALNFLGYGRKLWYLVPPANASFDTTPGVTWIEKELPNFVTSGIPIFECIQEAGDMLYIPHGWGHVVVNLMTSIGFVQNFEQIWGTF